MRIMNHKIIFSLLIVLFIRSSSLAQAPPKAVLDDVLEEIRSSGERVGGWLASQTGSHVGFSASSGDIVPAPILGFPHFRVTVGLGATLGKLDTGTLGSLPAEAQEVVDSIPPFILVPLPQFSIRAGLPGNRNTDLAIRFGGFPRFTLPIDDPKLSLVTRLFGLTLRQKILGGLALPSVSLALGFSRASGEISMKIKNEGNITRIIGPQTFDQKRDLQVSQIQAWSINTWSFDLKFSKKLPFFQPWVGAGVQWYKGSVTSFTEAVGTITLEESGNPSNKDERNVSESSISIRPPKNKDFKFLAGFWLGGAPFAIAFQYETQFTNDHAAFVGLTSGF